LVLSSNICVCHLSCLLPCRPSEYFTFEHKCILCWQKILNCLPCRLTSLSENTQWTQLQQSVNLLCLQWLTVLLFAVCNGFNVTFELPTTNRYNIHVNCTSSAYFIIVDLLYIFMSLWLHFVCNEYYLSIFPVLWQLSLSSRTQTPFLSV